MLTAPPLSRPNRAVRGFVVAAQVLLIAGILSAVWWWINRIPTVDFPPVILPEPNGYTRLEEATHQLVRDNDVVDAMRTPGLNSDGKMRKIFSKAEKLALVQANKTALEEVRAALRLPFEVPPKKTFREQSSNHDLNRFRQVARAFELEGKTEEEDGQLGDAANSYLDAIEEGTKTMQGDLFARNVGLACTSRGRRPLFALVDRLPLKDARNTAQRLETIFDAHPGPAKTLQVEKRAIQMGLADTFSRFNIVQSGDQLGFVARDENLKSRSPLQQAILRARLLLTSKQVVLTENGRHMDAIIDWASLPHSAEVPYPSSPADLFNRSFFVDSQVVYTDLLYRDLSDRVQTELLIGKLALRAYSKERGTYPATLEKLVKTGILRHLPTDSFAREARKPLQYRKTVDGFLLYSVGPDGIDDKGTPIKNCDPKYIYGYRLERDSKGDLVLNVNL